MKRHIFEKTCLRWLSTLALAAFLGGCAAGHDGPTRPAVLERIQPANGPVSYARLSGADAFTNASRRFRPMADLPKPLLAKIVVPKKPLQCVPYARKLSNIQIRGNAWTWWGQAEGRYPRSDRPVAGAVMVLKKKNAGSLGHVAYVEEVIDSRTVVVSHANWLNKGRLHNNTPVIDISENNDWSAVRFWNTEGGHFGGNTYHPYGFIHQNLTFAAR
ncbi:MAG: CHAP domain-containing protein [Alphaproteobacteria bacterium]|nr:CHAP domain-containing protein [Alphaproteobacteria bacterium]